MKKTTRPKRLLHWHDGWVLGCRAACWMHGVFVILDLIFHEVFSEVVGMNEILDRAAACYRKKVHF